MNIKFYIKLGKSATEKNEMIKSAYGDDAISHSRVSEQFARFQIGRQSTKDNKRSGRLCSSQNEENVQHQDPIVIVHSTKMSCNDL